MARALGLFSLGLLIHVLKGPHPILALYSASMLPLLVWYRSIFPAASDPGSALAVMRFIPGYLLAVGVFGLISLWLERARLHPDLSFGGAIETVAGGLFGLQGPYTYEGPFFRDFFPIALLALGVAGVLTVSVLIFRAVASRGPSANDRKKAWDLVHEQGTDTLAYFALRDDKSYFFSSDGSAMIAYTYVSGYALVSADPIGPAHALEQVVVEFLAFCRSRAWHVAFLAVRESDLNVYRRHGLVSVYLGEEAVIRCDRFGLEGSAMKSVRTAVGRFARHHHFRLIREVDARTSLRNELNTMREKWRGKTPERGFTITSAENLPGIMRTCCSPSRSTEMSARSGSCVLRRVSVTNLVIRSI